MQNIFKQPNLQNKTPFINKKNNINVKIFYEIICKKNLN